MVGCVLVESSRNAYSLSFAVCVRAGQSSAKARGYDPVGKNRVARGNRKPCACCLLLVKCAAVQYVVEVRRAIALAATVLVAGPTAKKMR